MTDRITDRTLERLRLGELSDEESKEVLERLEERGEMHRLEALIDDDQDFLERHPAPVAASQIREMSRRRRRAEAQPRETRQRARRFAIIAALGVALLGLAAGLFVLVAPNPTTPESVAESDTPIDDTTPEPSPAAPAPPRPAPEWNGLVDWILTHADGDLAAVACSPGDSLEFDANRVERVSVDQARLIGVSVSDDNKTLIATCDKEGLANVNIVRKGEPSMNLIVRIAPQWKRKGYFNPLGPELTLRNELEACGDLSEMALQIVVGHDGRPAMVIVGGGTAEERACVRKAAQTFEGYGMGAFEDDEPPPFAIYEREW